MSEKLGISIFRPTTNPKGCVEIIHGMAEHRKRYDDFAAFLRDNGYVVVRLICPGMGNPAGKCLDISVRITAGITCCTQSKR